MHKILSLMVTFIISCTLILSPIAIATEDNSSSESTHELACGAFQDQHQYVVSCYQDEKLICEDGNDECWCQLDQQCQKQCMSDQSCGQKADNNNS